MLIVADKFDETTYKAGRNVKTVQLTTADGVNTERPAPLQQDSHHARGARSSSPSAPPRPTATAAATPPVT